MGWPVTSVRKPEERILVKRKTFIDCLAETVSWCAARVDESDPKWCLRSDCLRPVGEYYSEDDPSLWNSKQTIATAMEKRRELLGVAPASSVKKGPLYGGRLLICWYDYTNHNGLSAEYSRWYFDMMDNPPWDTWVAAIGEGVVAWVPPGFKGHASSGVEVACLGTFDWLDEPTPALRERVPRWLLRMAV